MMIFKIQFTLFAIIFYHQQNKEKAEIGDAMDL